MNGKRDLLAHTLKIQTRERKVIEKDLEGQIASKDGL
jgi:hypothetical protein